MSTKDPILVLRTSSSSCLPTSKIIHRTLCGESEFANTIRCLAIPTCKKMSVSTTSETDGRDVTD